MQKTQLHKPLYVWLLFMLSLFCLLALIGQFHINDRNHQAAFGIYDPAVSSAARYNVAVETIGFLECVSLFFLPLLLLVCSKFTRWLKGQRLLPWTIVMGGVLLSVFIWPLQFGHNHSQFDPDASSELPTLLLLQIPLLTSVAVSILVALFSGRRHIHTPQ
ncbi:MAG TPA: hypothetical protein VHT70_04730 [Candidatus Saccharimonadales bacterium]|jgi:hypothetical protein|nr:hypothetical protein [Candidatus Saccharimonadales bacterium]